MERIFKILWGTGLTTLGLAALIYSKQETPSPSGLLLADGIISDISTNRGHYKFRITDHAGRFAYTNMGFCENLGGLRKQAAVSLLYAPPPNQRQTNALRQVVQIDGKEGPICSYSATVRGQERERKVATILGWVLLPLAGLAFVRAILHKNTPPTDHDLTLRPKRRGQRR